MEASRLTETNRPAPSDVVALGVRAAAPWSISFILPVGPSGEHLAYEVHSIAAALTGSTADCEILLIASSVEPAGLAAAQAVSQRCANARLVTCDARLSYGAAVRAGLQAADKDYVAIAADHAGLAATDLTWMSCLAARCDIVCGARVDRHEGWFRRLSSKCCSMTADLLLGTRVHDCRGAFKLLRRNVARSLELTSETTFLHAELLSQARLRGLSVVELDVAPSVPAVPAPRFSARSAFTAAREGLRFWWTKVMFPAPTATATARPLATVRPWHVCALFLIASAMLFSRLTFPLVEPDEARYALITANMYEQGDFLIPARQGMPYFDKPPLLYWLAAANFYILGMHDYAARLVPAIAGMGTVAATYFVGRRLVGQRGALLGALSLLLCLGFVLTARFFIMDGLLSCFTTWALLSLFVAVQGPRLRIGWWLLAAVACALGMLTKGPVILVVVVPPVIAWRWLSGTGAKIGLRPVALFAVVTAAIALPWFVAVAAREPTFIRLFLWEHHVMRFATNYIHAEPWWFYGVVLIPGMFPATFLLPILGTYLFRRTPALQACRTPAQGFLLLASAWTLFFFSFSTGKLAPYVLPAVPPICLLLGAMLDTAVLSEISDSFMTRMRRWIPFHGTRIALISGVVLGIADYIINHDKPHQLFESLLLIVASCVLYWYVSRASFALRPARWPMAAAVPLVLLALGMVDIFPTIAYQRSLSAQVIAFRDERDEPDIPVISFGYYEDSLIFYNPDSPIPQFNLGQRDDVRNFFMTHPRVLLIAQSMDLPQLRSYFPEGITLEDQARSRGMLHLALSPQAAARQQQLSATPGEQRR